MVHRAVIDAHMQFAVLSCIVICHGCQHHLCLLRWCRAPGRAREVKIVGVKRSVVVFVLFGLGIFLFWRKHALLYLAVATLIGGRPVVSHLVI